MARSDMNKTVLKRKKQQKSIQNEVVTVSVENTVAYSVRRLYEKSAPLLLCEGILFIIAGIFLMVRPVAVLTALTFIIGIGLVLFGLYRTISGFVTAHNVGGGWFDVIFGLMNIVFGVLFCVYPGGSLIGIIYIFVVLFVFKALRVFIFAINMVRARFGHYIFMMIMAVILVTVAILLLVWPMAGAIAMVYYLAITLLLYAFTDIYMFAELGRLRRSLAR